MYRVNEVFRTIQGEGSATGTPAVFVRLQGCAVGCAFCDTKHTWSTNPESRRSLLQVLQKTAEPREEFAEVEADELVKQVLVAASGLVRHVVITGGEPANYDLVPLTKGLRQSGLCAQVETSGTAPILVHRDTWVTLSPKIDQAGGLRVIEEAVARADEIKHPCGTQRDLDRLLELLARGWAKPGIAVWLQPLSQSENATERCIAWCYRYGFRLSIQTHKYIGLR